MRIYGTIVYLVTINVTASVPSCEMAKCACATWVATVHAHACPSFVSIAWQRQQQQPTHPSQHSSTHILLLPKAWPKTIEAINGTTL